MAKGLKVSLMMAGALALAAGSALAQDRQDRGGHDAGAEAPAHEEAPARAAPPRGEPHAGPSGYQRPSEPTGWNARPATVDRGAYQHNYQAARTYKVGPYHPPSGWTARRWAYGEIYPRAYWGADYLLADYWLFGLEIPPSGYEWVRDGSDALLIDLNSGQILQVEYGVFG